MFSDAPDKWAKFKTNYLNELKQNEAVKDLAGLINDNDTVTLLYAVQKENQNHALVLKEFVNELNTR